MIEIYVDEQSYEIPDDDVTVGGLLDHVRSAANKADRLIISVACQGRQLSPDELSAMSTQQARGLGRVDLITRPRAEVVQEIFTQAMALFDATAEPSQEAVDLLAQGQTVRAMEILGGNFKSWQIAHDSVMQAVGLAGLKIDELADDGDVVERAVARFRDSLTQVREALQVRDFVMLGDLLQYELPETLANWKQAIAVLRTATQTPDA